MRREKRKAVPARGRRDGEAGKQPVNNTLIIEGEEAVCQCLQ